MKKRHGQFTTFSLHISNKEDNNFTITALNSLQSEDVPGYNQHLNLAWLQISKGQDAPSRHQRTREKKAKSTSSFLLLITQ